MASDEIVSYIKKNLQNGRAEDLIKDELVAVGWSELEIKDALVVAKEELSSITIGEERGQAKQERERSKFLKETIKQFEDPSPTKKLLPNKLNFIPVLIIPIIIALSLYARSYYLEKNPIVNKIPENQTSTTDINATPPPQPKESPTTKTPLRNRELQSPLLRERKNGK